jgi:hypothetical protein
MQVPTPTMTSSCPRSPDEPDFSIHKCHNSGDSKDPEHPCYQYGYHEAYQQYVTGLSKDRASLEALKNHTPYIPHNAPSENVPSEDTPLDNATREDIIREDAPLATSHDPSLSLPLSDLAMPGGFD